MSSIEIRVPALRLSAAAMNCAVAGRGTLSASELAAAVSLTDTLIHSWEIGAEPLASVPVPQIDRLKSALRTAGAEARLVDDLDPAAWCDLVLEAMLAREDASCLLADPLASDPAFSELLTWAITGNPPARLPGRRKRR
ncbi:MAG TPA: hypothetical protein VMU94_24165 [Streptosporangiaceae bacterium]|nr:hypothetical protein [Streptosporangiaceae bacterium]